MSSKKSSQKIRDYYRHKNEIQDLVRDTRQMLENVNIQKVFSYGSMNNEIPWVELLKIQHFFDRDPTIIVFGQNNQSKAKLVNHLLGSEVLPTTLKNSRWVRFEYGILNRVRVSNTLQQDFEHWMEDLQNNWTTIPEDKLKLTEADDQKLVVINALINQPVLKDIPILVSSNTKSVEVLKKNSSRMMPLFIYALDEQSSLSKNNIEELCELKKAFPGTPICYVSSEFTIEKEMFTEDLMGSSERFSSEEGCEKSSNILECLIDNLKVYMLNGIDYLEELHAEVVQKFTTSKNDLKVELEAMPKRCEYAIKMAKEVRDSLIHLVDDKDKKMTKLLKSIISQMKLDTIETSGYWFQYSCMLFEEDQEHEWYKTMRAATLEVQNQVYTELRQKAAYYIALSVEKLHEKYFEPIYKCLAKLQPIGDAKTHESVVSAFSQLFLSACEIKLSHNSVIQSVMESINYFATLMLPPAVPKLSGSWQKTLKINFLSSLSPEVLVRTLRKNYQRSVNDAFHKFEMTLKTMVTNMNKKAEWMESQRETLHALHAPVLAKLALKTISLGNMIRFGMPEKSGGHFGSSAVLKNWTGTPVAVKTLCVFQDKYWRNFAMEVYQKVNLDHDRIVSSRAVMIKPSKKGAKVLLVTDQMTRNLELVIKNLPLLGRLQIALDVMEGIKYLHSLGLVHGNVQLATVLLDENDRAKLDIHIGNRWQELIKGTELPIHLAPELQNSNQVLDSSVDVYAFGFLLWSLLAGDAGCPMSFDSFKNVDEMWKGVKEGVRPEKLKNFSEECWNLMEQCWTTEPSKRPKAETIIKVLESVRSKIKLGYYEKEVQILAEFEEYEEVCAVQDFLRKSQELHGNYPKAILRKLSHLYRGFTS